MTVEFAPTPKQFQAITTIERDAAVSAGAGSGKTKVLVERFIYLLEQGFSLQQIAAITFTRKAAQEMRDRVRQQLLGHRTLHTLAEQMPQAQISTIHSLCQRILAEHPLEAEIDPRFRLGEEWEMDALLQDIAEEVVRSGITGGDRILLEVKEGFRQTATAAAELVSIYKGMVGVGQRSFAPGQDPKELEQRLHESGFEFRREYEALLAAHASGEMSGASPQKQSVLSNLQEFWQRLEPSLAGPPGTHILEITAKVRKDLGGNWGKRKELVIPLQEAACQWAQAWIDWDGYLRLSSISQTLQRLHSEFQDAKNQQGLLDFNDLEYMALQLLQNPSIKENYDFAHLMVDEFQDTNGMQKQIIDGLRTDATRLFIVGDAKQSIYRFRSADVQVFLDTQREIIAGGGVHISLDDNFRSVPSLVEFTNTMFPILMEGDAVEYHPSQAGRQDAASAAVEMVLAEAASEAVMVEQEDNASSGETLKAEQQRQLEAAAIANRVRRGWEQGEFGLEQVAFLFRTTTDIKLYERALQLEAIPFVNFSGRNFHSTREIRDILAFVAWLLDPGRELAKMAVLRSPFFLVSDEGLFWSSQGKEEQASSQDQERLREAEVVYEQLRRVALTEPAPRFFRKLFEYTQFCARTAAGPFGEQRLANLMKLEETSWQLWAQGQVTLQEQYQYIRQLMNSRDLEAEARVWDEDMEAVTIMTIHGSKGLEFPVVVLPDLNRRLQSNRTAYVSYHKDLGMALRDTSAAARVKEVNLQEEIAELKRLLYVAVTRAENKLILSGCRNGKEDVSGTWDSLKTWWEWLWCLRQQTEPSIADWVSVQRLDDDRETATKSPGPFREDRTAAASTQPILRTTFAPWQPVESLVVPQAIVNHSVTSLLAYEQCPRCYYYRYILRVPEQPRGLEPVFQRSLAADLPEPFDASEMDTMSGTESIERTRADGSLLPTQRGSIIHRICQFITDKGQLDQLLDKSLALEGVTVNEREHKNLLKMAERYTSSPSFLKYAAEHILREWEFQIEVGSSRVTGAVDQVFIESDGVVLSDLKTNHIGRRHLQAAIQQYRLQLELYAWAWSQVDSRPVKRIQLHFLVPGHIEVLVWNRERFQAIDGYVRNLTASIAERAEQGPPGFPASAGCTGSYACRTQFGESTNENITI